MFSPDVYRALHDSAAWLERDDTGRLWIRGEDRRSYLHNLLTNDIEGLAAGEGRYAALLTPNGRMVTDMHVLETGTAILMTVPRPLAAAILDRLDQFVFSEDVQVEDATDALMQIGVYGPDAAKIAAQLPAGAVTATMPADEFGVAGVELFVESAARDVVLQALRASGAVQADFATLDVCRIEAGVPRFLADMTEDTIPLEAGIEDRAISLTKGCYVGQEIIIRVLHRGGGRVARKLVRVALPAGAGVPSSGASVHAADGKPIGGVTSAADSPALRRPVALAYVHRDFVEPGTRVEIAAADGSRAAGEVLGR